MATRRMGPPDASVRFKLLDATERVLARDGYPAVTSRNVGQEAGVDQKLVFYYFRTMEELVVETFRRRSEEFLGRLEALIGAKDRLRQIWTLSSDRNGRLMMEFMAMSNRNAALRGEVRQFSARASEIMEAGLARSLSAGKLDPAIFTPAFMSFLISSLARNLILEGELGLLSAQDEVRRSIEMCLMRLEAGR